MKTISTVAIQHNENPDLYLYGRRRDNFRWTIPGGHCEQEETPLQGAVREALEEVGIHLTPDQLTHVDSVQINVDTPRHCDVHLFKAVAPSGVVLDISNDPDSEFQELRYLDPRTIAEQDRHVAADRDLLLRHINKQDAELGVNELNKAIHTPSKFINYKQLEQIKRDHNVGAKGKEYDDQSLDESIIDRKVADAERMVREADKMQRRPMKKKDLIPGGLAASTTNADFPKKKIKQGEKVELEHTSSKKVADEISRDHLTEDPNYYDKLKTIETKKAEPLMKPYRSDAQRRWAHTMKGRAALGGKAKVAHWDKESKGLDLPDKVAKAELQKDQPVIGLPKVKALPTRTDQDIHTVPTTFDRKDKLARATRNRLAAVLGNKRVQVLKEHLGLTADDAKALSDRQLKAKGLIEKVRRGSNLGSVIATKVIGKPMMPNSSVGLAREGQNKSTTNHEAAHLLLHNVEQKYGPEARKKVVTHVLHHFHPDDQTELIKYILKRGYKPNSSAFKEEAMNAARDILTNPEARDVLGHMGLKPDLNRMKAAWKNGISSLKDKDEEWLRSPQDEIEKQKAMVSAAKLTPQDPTKVKQNPAEKLGWKKLVASELQKGAARRLYGKFDPRKELDGDTSMGNWVSGNNGEDPNGRVRAKIPNPSPSARLRLTNKLANRTTSRLNPETKQREFLLHRQMSTWEFDKTAKNGRINHDNNEHTSWTPNIQNITNGKGIYPRESFDPEDKESYSHVVSAWVPESHIKNMPAQYGEAGTYDPAKRGTPTHTALKEQEVIVKPGHNSQIHEVIKDTGESPKEWNWQPKKLAASELQKANELPQLPQVKINPEHSKIIADAYGQMKHDPNHPAVKAAYGALAQETGNQFKDLLGQGYKFSKIQPGQENPYKTSKDMHSDIATNKHLWYFPTDQGYGSGDQGMDHPLLQESDFSHGGKQLLHNDVFRIVHDINGHHLGGQSGFGPKGEHQAFLQHKKMYSPLAQKALASETMGQNSYVNAGPNAEHNKKNPAQTIYAEQKAGLLPEHIINGKWHE